jgi:hypothetical protein
VSSDCFQQEEIEVLKSFDGQTLTYVAYYVWMHAAQSGEAGPGFLLCLELIFEDQNTLLLTSGENSLAIAVTTPAQFVQLAEKLRQINGKPVVQRIAALQQPLWQAAIGQPLKSILLSPHPDHAYYSNDALVFDFGFQRIYLHIGAKEGLELGRC